MKMHKRLITLVMFGMLAGVVAAQQSGMQFLSAASVKVAKASGTKNKWDGPQTGPTLQKNKKIVFVAYDMTDPTTNAVFNGMRDAVTGHGWTVLSIDCRGNCHTGAGIIKQAIGMKADGIVLAGDDAATYTKDLQLAAEKKVPVVGWHALAKTSSVAGLFTNVMTDPKEAGQIAALFGAAETNSKTGIVVIGDTSNTFASAKTNAMIETLKQCDACRVLSVEDIPVAVARKKMAPLMEMIAKKHGSKWTHVITVDDVYFDFMEDDAVRKIIAPLKLRGISAGNGSPAAFKRIRKHDIQVGTVSEPVMLNGWQLIDELNRAFSGSAPSRYVPSLHLTTQQNLVYDGGPQDMFDPSNDYKDKYRAIWVR